MYRNYIAKKSDSYWVKPMNGRSDVSFYSSFIFLFILKSEWPSKTDMERTCNLHQNGKRLRLYQLFHNGFRYSMWCNSGIYPWCSELNCNFWLRYQFIYFCHSPLRFVAFCDIFLTLIMFFAFWKMPPSATSF